MLSNLIDQEASAHHDVAPTSQQSPVVCRLPEADRRQRRDEIANGLWTGVRQVRELADGSADTSA